MSPHVKYKDSSRGQLQATYTNKLDESFKGVFLLLVFSKFPKESKRLLLGTFMQQG